MLIRLTQSLKAGGEVYVKERHDRRVIRDGIGNRIDIGGTVCGRRQSQASEDRGGARVKPPASPAGKASLPAPSSASETSERFNVETEIAAAAWRFFFD